MATALCGQDDGDASGQQLSGCPSRLARSRVRASCGPYAATFPQRRSLSGPHVDVFGTRVWAVLDVSWTIHEASSPDSTPEVFPSVLWPMISKDKGQHSIYRRVPLVSYWPHESTVGRASEPPFEVRKVACQYPAAALRLQGCWVVADGKKK